MRSTLKFGIGMGTAAIIGLSSAGVAAAAASGPQAPRSAAAVSAVASVNKHITRAEAKKTAKATTVRHDGGRQDRGDRHGRHHGDRHDRDRNRGDDGAGR